MATDIGWYKSNKRWVLPTTLIASVFAASLLIIWLLFSFFQNKMLNSEVLQTAMRMAQSNQEATANLGLPLEVVSDISSFQGSIQTSNFSGNAELSVKITGPKGKGTLWIKANKVAGKWNYEIAEIELSGHTERIRLLPPK